MYANAQDDQIQELKVGDVCPNIPLQMTNYSKSSLNLYDLKEKLIVIDFWATWCQPCREFLKTADNLESKFKDGLLILPVTYEDPTVAGNFLTAFNKVNNMNVYSIVNGTYWDHAFPHTIIPHEVWLDSNYRVIGITDDLAVTENNIASVLSGKPTNLPAKVNEMLYPIDENKPVLTGNQGVPIADSSVEYRCMVTKYVAGLHPGASNHPQALICLNQSLVQLYKEIAGRFDAKFFSKNSAIVEVKDTNKIEFPNTRSMDSTLRWARKHALCMEFVINDTALYAQKFDLALDQLNLYCKRLNIWGGIENRVRECYVLDSTGSLDVLRSRGGETVADMTSYSTHYQNASFKRFFGLLQVYYLQTLPYQIVNNTGINFLVDLNLTCNMTNIDELNKALSKYNLVFKRKKEMLPCLVIKDI
jgi:thiol-disulfide isomerase/thioredoxin